MGRLEGANTVKLYYDQEKLDKFLGSPMAKFWAEKGYPYKTLSPDESRLILPHLKSPQESDNEGLIAGVWNDPPADSTGDSKMFCQVRFTTVNNTGRYLFCDFIWLALEKFQNLENVCKANGVKIIKNAQVSRFNIDDKTGNVMSLDADLIKSNVRLYTVYWNL